MPNELAHCSQNESMLSLNRSLFILLLIIRTAAAAPKEPVDYVNPFIGTGKYCGPSKWDTYGGTYPGAVAPFGMVQITPETRNSGIPAGYVYGDSMIYWFSLLGHNSGFPSGSAGFFKIMPDCVADGGGKSEKGAAFNRQEEQASPGFYAVRLENGIKIEATVSQRSGFLRFTYPRSEAANLHLWDIREILERSEISISGKAGGWYFKMLLSQSFQKLNQDDNRISLSFSLPDTAPRQILVRVGFSMQSVEKAADNLDAEIPDWNFEQAREKVWQQWSDYLSQIEVEGGTERQQTIFYTALYHSLLLPCISSDVASEEADYDSFSPWDTFRTLHPLLTLLHPEMQGSMMSYLLRSSRQSGRFPHWAMSGNHIIAVLLDSYAKDIEGFDPEEAYARVRRIVLDENPHDPVMSSYLRLGFVPSSIPSSVSQSLEFAYDDWAASEFALLLGKTVDYQVLAQRAFNYRHSFNPSPRLMMPKLEDGSRSDLGGFEEGDAWDYTWFVPHNIQDLINLMGGRRAFTEQLKRIFSQGHYLHDNEPPLHCAYLFNYAGEAWRTQKWVRHILDSKYSTEPGGFPGNDDLGSLSSWYVFSAMGFFPVCPGRPIYAIASPIFSKVTIHLENGKNLQISAAKVSGENIYIQSASLNGKPLGKAWLEHSELAAGGSLEFLMGAQPNKTWANSKDVVLPSLTTDEPQFTVGAMTLSASQIKPHELLTVTVPLTNAGALGTKELRLSVDDQYQQSEWIMVDSGQTAITTINLRLYEPGKHSISLESGGSQIVKVIPENGGATPKFELSDFKVTPIARVDNPMSISAVVQNIGGIEGRLMLPLLVDGWLVDSMQVALEPGERHETKFTANLAAGIYQISVGYLPAQKVKVYGEPLESSVLQLSFDELTGGTVLDVSGLDNHGHCVGNVELVPGKVGQGVRFADDGYIELPQTSSLDINGNTLTMMVWIYPIDDRSADFFTKGDYNVLKLQSRFGLPVSVDFFAGGWGRGECRKLAPKDWDCQWHHVAGVCNGSELKLYFDGELVQSCPISGDIGHTPFTWNLGRNAEKFLGRRLKGCLDEARIYVESLTQEEIQKAMNMKEEKSSRN